MNTVNALNNHSSYECNRLYELNGRTHILILDKYFASQFSVTRPARVHQAWIGENQKANCQLKHILMNDPNQETRCFGVENDLVISFSW